MSPPAPSPRGPRAPAAHAPAAPVDATDAPSARPRWRRWASAAFLALVAVLLVRAARDVPWGEVLQALRGLPATTVAMAVALAAAGHAVFAGFDVVGRAVAGHRLPARTVLRIAAICYAVNQNLGYLVGGVALRLRLYGEAGLDLATTATVAATAVLTNWMGWAALLGVLLVVSPPDLPADWPVGLRTLQAVGGVALIAVAGFVAACFRARRRRWTWRRLDVTLPPGRLAVGQLALGVASWLLMGSIVWVSLPAGTPWAPVVTTLLLAAIAGVVAHVPAGLGVLEAVFVALLSPQVPAGALLAALLVYRAAYQWLPGGVALGLWATRARGAAHTRGRGPFRRRRRGRPRPGP